MGQAGASCCACLEAQDSVLPLRHSQVLRGSAAGGRICHPNTAGARHHGQAEPGGACRARRASKRLGPWLCLGNSTEGEGERRLRPSDDPPLAPQCVAGRVGRGNPAPLGRSGLPRGPAPRCSRAPPAGRGAAPPRKGGAVWAGASREKGACGARVGSGPLSQPPPPAFRAQGPAADFPGAFSRLEGPSAGRPADSPTLEFSARPRQVRARRGRILRPAAGSAGAAGPGATSRTGLARERTREPRESLAAPRGDRPNLRSRQSQPCAWAPR